MQRNRREAGQLGEEVRGPPKSAFVFLTDPDGNSINVFQMPKSKDAAVTEPSIFTCLTQTIWMCAPRNFQPSTVVQRPCLFSLPLYRSIDWNPALLAQEH